MELAPSPFLPNFTDRGDPGGSPRGQLQPGSPLRSIALLPTALDRRDGALGMVFVGFHLCDASKGM